MIITLNEILTIIINGNLVDCYTMEGTIKKEFPDWKTMECGTWSQYGRIYDIDKRKYEIGLYREPMDDDEYAGTYTLQIFDGDDVIYCAKVF